MIPILRLAPLLAVAACVPAVPPRTPPDLVGTWETSAPRYADRSLTFGANATVGFGQGDGDGTTYPLASVKKEVDWPVMHYEITYVDEFDEEVPLACSYDAEQRSLTLDYQKGVVWRNRDAAAR